MSGVWADKRSNKTGARLLRSTAIIFILCVTPPSIAQDISWRSTVTEQDIYNNPDDHELNLRYAKEQIKLGEMLNAGSALERMLYGNPNWHSARLLYAAILYRLDDPKAALRELSLLEGKELNQDQLETLERFKAEFQTPHKMVLGQSQAPQTSPQQASPQQASPQQARTQQASPEISEMSETSDGQVKPITPNRYKSSPHTFQRASGSKPVSSRLTLGVSSDNNAGNTLTDESFGFGNKGDISGFIQGHIETLKALKPENGLNLRLRAGALVKRHETYSQADHDVYDLRAGIISRQETGHNSFDLAARQLSISGTTYLTQIGPRLSFTRSLNELTQGHLSLSAYSQDYHALDFATREDERDGLKTSINMTLVRNLNPHQRIIAALGYTSKAADLDAFAYDGPIAAIEFEHNFDNRRYFKTRLRLKQLNYDSSLSSGINKREDSRVSARASFGIPLMESNSTEGVRAVSVELGANYNNRDSNINANDFENLGVDLRLNLDF